MTQLDVLNTPISSEEITCTVKALANNKALGPKGYTTEFNKAASKAILPSLLSLYNTMWDGGSYMPTGSQAYNKLLAKKGKDSTLPGSYRPISLLNLDAKILSKIIASP